MRMPPRQRPSADPSRAPSTAPVRQDDAYGPDLQRDGRPRGRPRQVHRLDHASCTGEVPQHTARPDALLVDQFDGDDDDLVCLDNDRLVGLLAVRDRRPFRLDRTLDDLDRHLPAGRSLCEVRLLASSRRTGAAPCSPACSLCSPSTAPARPRHGPDLGLRPAAAKVPAARLRAVRTGGGGAGRRFQSMYLTAQAVAPQLPPIEAAVARVRLPRQRAAEPLSLLPGPVPLPAAGSAAHARPPQGHRWPDSLAALAACASCGPARAPGTSRA